MNLLAHKKTILLILLISVVVATAGGTSWYFFSKYQAAKNPDALSRQQIQETVDAVGKLMDLPTDEQPTIATVSDKTKLQKQPFFANAEDGDKVLIYAKAKKAILYRPSADKIIEVGPLTIADTTPKPSSESATLTQIASQSARVSFFNGTNITGLATIAEKLVKNKIPSVTTASKENAQRHDYKESVVVDVTGKNSAVANAITSIVGGNVGKLPDGEFAPANADIVVILGTSASPLTPTPTGSQ